MLTGICLDPGSDLARTNIVEKGDVLTENGGEVFFAETFCTDFRSVRPNGHVYEVGSEHAGTWEGGLNCHRRLINRRTIPM